MSFVFILSMLLVGSLSISVLTRSHFSSVVPFFIFGLILFLYIFSLIDALKIGIFASYVVLFLLCISASVVALNQPSKFFIPKLTDPWLIIFIVVSFLNYISTRTAQFSHWDEFSHWGLVVKTMYEHDAIAPFNPSNMIFRSYPPGLSLWQYFVQGGGLFGPFSEGKVIWASRLFELSLLTPFMRFLKWTEPLEIVIVSSLFLLLPHLFPDSYLSIYVDIPLGLCFGFLLSWVYLKTEFRIADLLPISLGVATLILLKDSGSLLAYVVVCVVFFRVRFVNLHEQLSLQIRKSVEFTLPLFIFALALIASWKFVLKSQEVLEVFNQEIRLKSLVCFVDESCPPYWNKVLSNFLSALFRTPITSGFIGKSLVIFALVLIVFLYAIFGFNDASRSSIRKRRDTYTPVVLLFSLLFYVFGLLILYLFRFSEYEAVRLASFSRYLSTFVIGLIFFLSVAITKLVFDVGFLREHRSIVQMKGFVELKYSAATWLALIYLSSTVAIAGSPITGQIVKDEGAAAVRQSVSSIASELVRNGALAGDKVWFINQYSTGFEYVILKYELADIDFADSWSIGVPSGESDVWTNARVTSEYWDTDLTNYRFVALMNINELFAEQYFGLFGGKDLIKPFTIYKVNLNEGLPRLTSGIELD